MQRQVIAAQLLRVDHSLSLIHPLKKVMQAPRRSSDSTPAVLIIPRGGNPREPHLITIENLHGPWDGEAPACVMTDPHTVMCAEDVGEGGDGRRTADVVVHRDPGAGRGCAEPADQVSHPPAPDLGCDIAASSLATRCVLRLRDTKTVEIKGPAALLARAAPSWLAVYGSVVHCWLTAGLSISMLGDAVVAAGHYYVGTSSRDCRFSVAGRALVFVTQPGQA